jgi:hypothetical protein
MKDSLYKGLVAAPGGFLAGAVFYFLLLNIWFPIIIIVLLPIILLHLILVDRGISTKKMDNEKITFGKILVYLAMPAVVYVFFYLGFILTKLLLQITIYITS